jgi:hypothetical protein
MARGSAYLRFVVVLALVASAIGALTPASARTHRDRHARRDGASRAALATADVTSDPKVSFTVQCGFTRSLTDDPIVFPNQPGASHLHDYFGNRAVDAFSTYGSLLGQPTSCANEDDTAGYWVPAVYLNDVKVQPVNLRAYYSEQVAVTQAFPPGLGMVAGDSRSLGPQSVKRVYFGCGNGSGISKVNMPPNCTGTGGRFTVHVIFPTCLNPANNAVAYEPCPAGYTVTMPQLTERIIYPIVDARTITLASGPAYTYHADFYNSWDQAALRSLLGLPASGTDPTPTATPQPSPSPTESQSPEPDPSVEPTATDVPSATSTTEPPPTDVPSPIEPSPTATNSPSPSPTTTNASPTPTTTSTSSPSPTTDRKVSFTVQCGYTRSLSDDPIVFPGAPGASHLHDYFGNRTVDAWSTYGSLIGQPTSCANPADTAGYWAPAVFLNGTKIQPTNLRAYYSEDVAVTQPFPPGLGIVAGNSGAFGPQAVNRVYFGCGSGTGLSKVDYAPNCTGTGGKFTVHVIFPTCLNPSNNAVAYEPCPAGYTTKLPKLTERIIYPIIDARGVMLASGPVYTYHADFYNSWDQEALTRMLQGG